MFFDSSLGQGLALASRSAAPRARARGLSRPARAAPAAAEGPATIVRPARDMHKSRRGGSGRLSYISKIKTLPGPDGGRAECVTRESTQNTALQRAATRSFHSALISRIAPASEPRRIRQTSRASPANGEGSNPQGAEHRMRSFLSGAAPSARKVRVACVAVGGLGTSRIAALGAPSCMVRIACSKLAPSIVMSTPRGDK